MDFIDEVRTRSGRFAKRLEHLQDKDATEEATKTSFVLPFIQMLGYDIFSPAEVIPEFTADIGLKKGEKVDYALLKDETPVVLIECKRLGSSLAGDAVSQLVRYFGVTEARVGILTDGLRYLFFSDLDQSNIMDPRPFFEFYMLEFTDIQARELKRFTRDEFDKSQIVDAARELRYTAEIKRMLARELSKPSDEFVTYVISQVYEGRKSVSVRKMFRALAFTAFNQFINDKIQGRLANALKQEGKAEHDEGGEDIEEKPKSEFTNVELDALNTIKAILGGLVDPRCLGLRRNKAYCSIVLHGAPEKDDFGVTVFRLRVRRPDFMRLSGQDMAGIRLGAIEELFSHTDELRQFVKAKLDIAEPASPQPDGRREDAQLESGKEEMSHEAHETALYRPEHSERDDGDD